MQNYAKYINCIMEYRHIINTFIKQVFTRAILVNLLFNYIKLVTLSIFIFNVSFTSL